MSESIQPERPPDPWRKDDRIQEETAPDFGDRPFRRPGPPGLDDYGYPDIRVDSRPLARRLTRLGASILDGLAGLVCLGPGFAFLIIQMRQVVRCEPPLTQRDHVDGQ